VVGLLLLEGGRLVLLGALVEQVHADRGRPSCSSGRDAAEVELEGHRHRRQLVLAHEVDLEAVVELEGLDAGELELGDRPRGRRVARNGSSGHTASAGSTGRRRVVTAAGSTGGARGGGRLAGDEQEAEGRRGEL
jgi:hypothetical protein